MCFHYCLQVCVKVMFLRVSVILSTAGRGCIPAYITGHMATPPRRHPRADTPAGYGQWAGGTHPTGMNSCSKIPQCNGHFVLFTMVPLTSRGERPIRPSLGAFFRTHAPNVVRRNGTLQNHLVRTSEFNHQVFFQKRNVFVKFGQN